jgi:plasmid stabilization system protein ParE
MNVIWSDRARKDLKAIHDHIATDNPIAAQSWVARIRQRAGKAARFPKAGRIVPEWTLDDHREVFLGAYRIVYHVGQGRIEVITVFEGHRQMPEDVDPAQS